MAYEVILNRQGVYRVLLEERQEGVYVNVFQSPQAEEPYLDWLAPNLQGAKLKARREYGVQEEEWKQVPNEPWH